MIKPQKELLDFYVVQHCLLANSLTFNVGDAVIITAATPSTVSPNGANTTSAIFGTIVSFNGGVSSGNNYLQKEQVITAADNTTNAQISCDVLLSNNLATLIADVDAAVGTTTNSQYFGYFAMKSGSSGLLLESSYSAATPKQFLSFGQLPGSTTQVFGIWSAVGRI